MDGFQVSRSLKATSESSTHPSTRDEWRAFQEASLARILASLEGARVLTAPHRDSGPNSLACFARYDPASHSLKTAQLSLLGDSTECCRILPRWGSMRSGQLFQRPTLGLRICENASGSWLTPNSNDSKPAGKKETEMCMIYESGTNVPDTYKRLRAQVAAREATWPTPTATDYKGAQTRSQGKERPVCDDDLPTRVKRFPTPTCGDSKAARNATARRTHQDRHNTGTTLTDAVVPIGSTLNPTWVEFLMNWPLQWTRLTGGWKSPKASRASRKASMPAAIG